VKAHPFVEAEKAAGHGVARACRLLKVSRAAYYQRRTGAPAARRTADAAITARIISIHTESGGTYGSPRVHQVLRRDGVSCGKRRAARLMRAAGLEGRRKKRWRTTTIADPAAERARDLIQRDFVPRPGTDRRYAGDITYIMTWEGWAYLATVIDLSSRRVVGWALADHMRTSLVEDALVMAFTQRRPAAGVIFHSDRGCQGGFNRSSQHLDYGGVRWDAVGGRCRWRLRVLGGSGRRIGRCGRRCGHRAGLSPLVRCSGSSGG
jgi:transposase InsO family protein